MYFSPTSSRLYIVVLFCLSRIIRCFLTFDSLALQIGITHSVTGDILLQKIYLHFVTSEMLRMTYSAPCIVSNSLAILTFLRKRFFQLCRW